MNQHDFGSEFAERMSMLNEAGLEAIRRIYTRSTVLSRSEDERNRYFIRSILGILGMHIPLEEWMRESVYCEYHARPVSEGDFDSPSSTDGRTVMAVEMYDSDGSDESATSPHP